MLHSLAVARQPEPDDDDLAEQVPVRIATPRDEDGILDLCWQAHAEMPGGRSLCKPKVLGMVRVTLAGQGIIGVIGGGGHVASHDDNRVQAMIGLIVNPAWFSEDPELHDWLAFVRPDCRNNGYFVPLILFAKAQAIKLRMPLNLGFIGREREAAKARAYRRLMPAHGAFYRFDPNDPNPEHGQ